MTGQRIDVAAIPGNASNALKQALLDLATAAPSTSNKRIKPSRTFESDIISRIAWTDVSIVAKAEEPEKQEGRVVGETVVREDMMNNLGSMHGACIALLIDNCSSLPIALLGLATTGKGDIGVSQSLNILYHAPANLDDTVRIVSTTISLGSRVLSSRCEIWNVTKHRLVASAVHTKMAAAPAPRASKL